MRCVFTWPVVRGKTLGSWALTGAPNVSTYVSLRTHNVEYESMIKRAYSHAQPHTAKEMISSTGISSMTASALKRKLDKLQDAGFNTLLQPTDGQEVTQSISHGSGITNVQSVPVGTVVPQETSIVKAPCSVIEKTKFQMWSQTLNKWVVEHNKTWNTHESITLMESGLNKMKFRCAVCGNTEIVLDVETARPFKNLAQHILRGQNHLHQYKLEHVMTPLYPSCQDRGEESDTPFEKEITHEDLQRILQEHGLQEALQASADGANVSCNTCNKKLDFKAPKTFAYVHSNKHLQHTNTVTNASSPSAQKSKEVVTIPSTGSLLTHAHTASKDVAAAKFASSSHSTSAPVSPKECGTVSTSSGE